MSRPDVFENIAALLAALTTGQRLLGLDIGDKTIGLAISDPMFMIASPVKTIMRTKKFATAVAEMREIVKNEEVGGMLVGLPVSMDGNEGPRCQKTRDLTSEISMQLNLPAAFWDERLSTSAIERFLVTETDMTRKRRKDVVDKMAAGYILQGALDFIAGRF